MKATVERARKRGQPRATPALGLVVEGDTEFEALPLLHTKKLLAGCPPLKAINLGGIGSNVDPRGIARRVCPHVVTHILAGRSTVVVCLDREDRDECPGAFADAVAHELSAELLKTSVAAKKTPYEVRVVIANRAFEAWILADARGLHERRVFVKAPSFHSFEGQLGKRRRMGEIEIGELLDSEYRKTRDGPRLFEKLRFADARMGNKGQRGSSSLDKLLRTLGV